MIKIREPLASFRGGIWKHFGFRVNVHNGKEVVEKENFVITTLVSNQETQVMCSSVMYSHFSISGSHNILSKLLQCMLLSRVENYHFQHTGPPDQCNIDSTGPTKLSLACLHIKCVNDQVHIMLNYVAFLANVCCKILILIYSEVRINTKPCKLRSRVLKFYWPTGPAQNRFYWPNRKSTGHRPADQC